jgi:3-deoxy-D-manno-octulosonate 8-phosphate phosphatase (KDO 8-P phosphatase)
MAHRPTPLSAIRLLVLDVDGVLTDGGLRYGPTGETEKVFYAHDGPGIKALIAAGVKVAVMSGRNSAAVQRRCEELGISELQQGIVDKAAAGRFLAERLGVKLRDCACMGDDSVDVPLMKIVGLAIAVANAHGDARRAAHRRTRLPGGAGAVREVCDWLLAARARAKS